jgi:hypothetical protein
VLIAVTGGNCHKIDLAIIVDQAHTASRPGPQEMPAERENREQVMLTVPSKELQ